MTPSLARTASIIILISCNCVDCDGLVGVNSSDGCGVCVNGTLNCNFGDAGDAGEHGMLCGVGVKG